MIGCAAATKLTMSADGCEAAPNNDNRTNVTEEVLLGAFKWRERPSRKEDGEGYTCFFAWETAG